MADDIILGEGVFSIGATDIGLTRGGGQFVVEREYRNIEADGDYGPVKGRVRKIRSVPKLTVNALEMLPVDFSKFYPATNVDSATTVGTDAITAKKDIEDTDYNDTVKWTGRTKSGRSVIITLENAINLENIDWSMVDKEEIVPVVTFTATYLEGSTDTEPWKLEYVD
jgi:hypothetical protein